MWPISPASPRGPSRSWPSRMSPAPTPVPANTPRRSSTPSPAPRRCSASVPTLTSLPTTTGRPPRRSLIRSATGTSWSQPGRFGAAGSTPVPGTTGPGAPMPIAVAVASGSTDAATFAMVARTSSGEPTRGVGRFAFSTTTPSSTRTASVLVPPRSMPIVRNGPSLEVRTRARPRDTRGPTPPRCSRALRRGSRAHGCDGTADHAAATGADGR